MLEILREKGFEIQFQSHAAAILEKDFPEAVEDLEGALRDLTIPISEIIGSGGGETKGTQRMRRALNDVGWDKFIFEIRKIINGIERESISHEMDHVKRFGGNTLALELEWNWTFLRVGGPAIASSCQRSRGERKSKMASDANRNPKPPVSRPAVLVFRNYYKCPDDGTTWHDDWSCMCDDRCPTCDIEVEPYESEDI